MTPCFDHTLAPQQLVLSLGISRLFDHTRRISCASSDDRIVGDAAPQHVAAPGSAGPVAAGLAGIRNEGATCYLTTVLRRRPASPRVALRLAAVLEGCLPCRTRALGAIAATEWRRWRSGCGCGIATLVERSLLCALAAGGDAAHMRVSGQVLQCLYHIPAVRNLVNSFTTDAPVSAPSPAAGRVCRHRARRHVTGGGVFESRDDGAFAHPRMKHIRASAAAALQMRYATGAMAASESRLCVGERRERVWPRVRRRRRAGAVTRAP